MAALGVALIAIGVLVAMPEPQWATTAQPPLDEAPSALNLPESVTTPAKLADGADYTPRLFLAADTSIGQAPTRDGRALRLVLVTPSAATELRQVDLEDQPQFDGFAASGGTVVWAESVTTASGGTRTSIWRSGWRNRPSPSVVTDQTGEVTFAGSQYDVVVHSGRVYWTAAATGGATSVRSVALDGAGLTTKRLAGSFALTAWPWAVTVDGGRGKPVELVNYDTDARQSVVTSDEETVVCSPQWCRVIVLGAESLTRMELVRPDGSGRRPLAGTEATPTLVDVALLDRFVPLATDRGAGAGLSLFDITTGQTELIAADASSVRGSGAMLWWSGPADGSDDPGAEPTWRALDLRSLA
jgi:hypothetical protein